MWHRSETYWLLDRTIKVRSQSDEFSEYLASLLAHAKPPHLAARSKDSYFIRYEDGKFSVYRDCAKVVEVSELNRAMDLFLADLNRHLLYSYEGFAAHAGTVGHPNGRVVVLPGESGAGKSTLTAAAVQAGFEYLSDEAVCVEYGSTLVQPYLKPINLLDWSRHHLGIDSENAAELPVSPGQLGAIRIGPGEVTDVVFLDRPGDLELIQRRGNEAVGRLIEMSFNHYREPAKTFETVTKMAQQSQVWTLTYDDPIKASQAMFEWFS